MLQAALPADHTQKGLSSCLCTHPLETIAHRGARLLRNQALKAPVLSFVAVSVGPIALARCYLVVDWKALEGRAGLVAPATPEVSFLEFPDHSRHNAGSVAPVISSRTCSGAHPISRWPASPKGFASAFLRITAACPDISSCWQVCLSLLRYACYADYNEL